MTAGYKRPMDNHQVRTLKCEGRVNTPKALDRTREVLSLLAEIHDGCLYLLRLAENKHPDRYTNFSLQRELKDLRADLPEFTSLGRRLQEGAVKRASASWNRYKKATKADDKAGRPRCKSGRYRTISLDSPQSKVLYLTEQGNAVLRIHTLPAIRLLTTQEIPTDRQPVAVRITLKRKRISVRLSYRMEIPATGNPEKANKPLGIDLGIALSVTTSTGIAYCSPRQQYLERQVVKARRKLSHIMASAMATGRAGYRAVLDDSGKQILSKKGKPMRRLVWSSGQPIKSYLKARRRLSTLTDRLASMRQDFRHRVSTAIIVEAGEQEIDLLVMEDLQVSNMTRSARGTAKSPGRNLQAKSGLNRYILGEAWGETLSMLEYKAERACIPNAQGTSITCSCCGDRDRESRTSQARFACTACKLPGQRRPERLRLSPPNE